MDAETDKRADKKHGDEEDAAPRPVPVSASPRPRVSASPSPRVHASEWRLFCAVELSEEARAAVAAHIARLRGSLPEVRAGWERPEKLHLTLKFFGDTAQERVQALSLAVERAASAFAPFALVAAGTGAFPPRGSARVLWLGLHDASGTLARLQQALENECAAAGLKREERPFHPHITLARPRPSTGARELAALHLATEFPAVEFPVTEVVLIRSELGPKGSRYTALSHHRLAL
jgi:2'-5' RNA ligase